MSVMFSVERDTADGAVVVVVVAVDMMLMSLTET